jgi:hypothetical protein
MYVFPFIFLSHVNIACIGFIGDYSTLYVVRTPILLQAERRGGIFDGSVGMVDKDILEQTRNGSHETSSKSDGDDVTISSGNKELGVRLLSESTQADTRIMIPECFEIFPKLAFVGHRLLPMVYLVIVVGP